MHESRWVILFKIHCVLQLTLCLKHDRKGIFDLLNDNPDYGDMCGHRMWRAGMKRRGRGAAKVWQRLQRAELVALPNRYKSVLGI